MGPSATHSLTHSLKAQSRTHSLTQLLTHSVGVSLSFTDVLSLFFGPMSSSDEPFLCDSPYTPYCSFDPFLYPHGSVQIFCSEEMRQRAPPRSCMTCLQSKCFALTCYAHCCCCVRCRTWIQSKSFAPEKKTNENTHSRRRLRHPGRAGAHDPCRVSFPRAFSFEMLSM